MAKLIHRILDIGIYEGMPVQAQRQLGALNGFVLVAIIFNIAACVIYRQIGLLLYVTLATTTFCIFLMVMNALFQYRLSRMLLINYMLGIAAIVSCLLGREAYYQLILLMESILAMLLFDRKEVAWKYYGVLAAIGIYFMLEFTHYELASRILLPRNLHDYTPIIILTFCFSSACATLYGFTRNDDGANE